MGKIPCLRGFALSGIFLDPVDLAHVYCVVNICKTQVEYDYSVSGTLRTEAGGSMSCPRQGGRKRNLHLMY
jgi:hypothetical protein